HADDDVLQKSIRTDVPGTGPGAWNIRGPAAAAAPSDLRTLPQGHPPSPVPAQGNPPPPRRRLKRTARNFCGGGEVCLWVRPHSRHIIRTFPPMKRLFLAALLGLFTLQSWAQVQP